MTTDGDLGPLTPRVPAALRGATAYHVPAPSQLRAKLDANEFPHPWPEALRDGLGHHLSSLALERYPDAGALALRARVATRLGVDGGRVVFGNGSDELIAMLCAGFSEGAEAPPAILYPWPSFVYYRMAATNRGIAGIEVPLRADFTLDEPAMIAAIERHRPSVVFFALPNNPTGTLWRIPFVLELIERFPDIIFVSDEAYGAYSGWSLLDPATRAIADAPNVVVMQTLSKIGMAGLRVGYAVAAPAVASVLEKVRPPYNLSSLDQAAACYALDHVLPWVEQQLPELRAERATLAAALAELPGVTVYDSAANLVMLRVDPIATPGRARAVAGQLAQRGILVRNFDAPGAPPAFAGCLRITVGTPAENRLVIAELRALWQ